MAAGIAGSPIDGPAGLPALGRDVVVNASVAAFAAAGGRFLRLGASLDDEDRSRSRPPGRSVLNMLVFFSGLGVLEFFFCGTDSIGVNGGSAGDGIDSCGRLRDRVVTFSEVFLVMCDGRLGNGGGREGST